MKLKGLAIGTLMAFTTIACGQQQVSAAETFSVNQTVYENEYAVVTLKDIKSDGIYFDVQSKLANRAEQVCFYTVALDGLCVDAHDYWVNSMEPGETISVVMEGNIQYPEHKTITIAGELFDDTGNGFSRIDVVDFELGGAENAEYQIEPLFTEFTSDHIDVDYLGIDNTGIRLAIKNKNDYTINIVCDSLAINGEDTGSYYSTIFIPGHTTNVYSIDVYNGRPDLIPENITSFEGKCHTWGPNGSEEDSFSIFSEAPPKEAPKIKVDNFKPVEETAPESEPTESVYKGDILNAESLLGISVDSSGDVEVNDQLVDTAELYGYSGHFVPSADKSGTRVEAWKYIFDQNGMDEFEAIVNGMTGDFGTPDNCGDIDGESLANWDNTATNIRLVLYYIPGRSLTLNIYNIEREDQTQSSSSSGVTHETQAQPTTPPSKPTYTHICEADGCKNVGTHSMAGASGATEWYCDEHYQVMMDILDMMEDDIRNSNSSASFSSGSSSTLAYDATLEFGSGDVEVFASEDAMERYTSALIKDNQGTIVEMIMTGEVGYVPKGTKCNIIKRGFAKDQVRILEGSYAGATVWVVIEAVKEK